MATASRRASRPIEYPDGDGKPVAETPIHRDNLLYTVAVLARHFEGEPMIYVSGNMMMYYVEGDVKQCVSPDVFLVRGIPRDKPRRSYKTWEEGGHAPDFIIEFTSRKTRREDREKKLPLYRDTMAVSEYFLFDPYDEYLKPALQGFRLVNGQYQAIEPIDDRLPSAVTGLHLERDGQWLRLFNPATGRRVLMDWEARNEAEATLHQAEAELHQTEVELQQSEEARRRAEDAWRRAEAENEALRRELEALRRQRNGGPPAKS